ncbi:hypothetical protein SKAU_G00235210 [Synaphobranchus kaupii]|uniref:Uncharacterized protein n=1 Tax=Synaphobranchus kaupii TaxID=118154 RepID=A0A9Q1ISS1_SYNKA|nr:hypothetical protein SKAU_G00235210 [Synaphobranchus kaupii]
MCDHDCVVGVDWSGALCRGNTGWNLQQAVSKGQPFLLFPERLEVCVIYEVTAVSHRGIVRVWRLGTAAGHNVHLSWGCGNGGVSASRCVFLSSEVPIVTEELSVGCENSHG